MITCFIRYDIEPFKIEAYEEYARAWGQIIPRNGVFTVPQQPGLGRDPDAALIARMRVD